LTRQSEAHRKRPSPLTTPTASLLDAGVDNGTFLENSRGYGRDMRLAFVLWFGLVWVLALAFTEL
jgi:hypothetical protein